MFTENTNAFYGVLETRYDAGFSQAITDETERLNRRDIQFLEIKELNDLQADYRMRLRDLLHSYRKIKKNSHQSSVQQYYASHEGIFIRRQIADLWEVYRTVVSDCHEMTAEYLQQLKTKKH